MRVRMCTCDTVLRYVQVYLQHLQEGCTSRGFRDKEMKVRDFKFSGEGGQ